MCEGVSERMPSVAGGRADWSPAEREHLAMCRDCAAEWKLVSATATLGHGVTVDAAQISVPVLARVRAAMQAERRQLWARRAVVAGGLAMAAALLLLILPRHRGVSPAAPSPVAVATAAPELQLAELDGAAPAELEMVLAELDEPAEPLSALDGPDLEGLDMSQVEHALRSWEES